MRRVANPRGYTIVEVMIVLAVSGAILAAVATVMSGQDGRQRFQANIRELQSQIQDVLNDTENGYYSNDGSTTCVASGMASQPVLSSGVGSRDQGTNDSCIFLGKAFQFYQTSPSDPISKFRDVAVAGRRRIGTQDVKTPAEARPVAFSSVGTNGVEEFQLHESFEYIGARFSRGAGVVGFGAPVNNDAGFAVISGLKATTGSSTDVASADGRSIIYELPISHTDASYTSINSAVSASLPGPYSFSVGPRTGVALCFQEAGGGRKAAILVGLRIDEATGAIYTTGQMTAESYFDNTAGSAC